MEWDMMERGKKLTIRPSPRNRAHPMYRADGNKDGDHNNPRQRGKIRNSWKENRLLA
jgi:hypothetical protein